MPPPHFREVVFHIIEFLGDILAKVTLFFLQHNNVHFCGATILDQVTLLSAASCFYGNTYVDGISIRAGSIHKSDGQVCLSVFIQFLKHYIF